MGVLVVSIIIGTQFLLSAWAKVRDLPTFLAILANYPLIASLPKKTFAFLIIIFEICLGFSLISFQGELIRLAFFGAIIFIICANILAFIRLIKGEKKFRCGCGESLNEEQSSFWLLFKNFVWLFVLLFCVNQNIPTVFMLSKASLNIFLIGFGFLAIIKLLLAFYRAIANIKQWKAAG